ncbi:MAG: hypothetical protein HKN97_12535 [Myxococcales bacterium]|nr:hypothetical protein [Deltaproteobacteria bacterium]NND29410.1 hypothetical protein [Myxococcales bacterium]NNK08672.1 hypothetical protein [Myxococcales bacterium]RZV49267.1 MAG: hypothetical protein EX268_19215 [Deltaproteobacteria bacterium]
MNRSLLTIAIILSLGTVGCAGFGVQQSSSLSGQFHKQQGLDQLWSSSEEAPAQGLETPRYADQSLGNLWNDGVGGLEAVRGDAPSQSSTAGDLWNPASVSRSWETSPGKAGTPSRSLLFGDSSGGRIWY